MKIIENNVTKWSEQADAEAIAKVNRENDPDWSYVTSQGSDGMWRVAVYDEDGEHLGML